jgi:uncharacterized protein (DUF305 family)
VTPAWSSTDRVTASGHAPAGGGGPSRLLLAVTAVLAVVGLLFLGAAAGALSARRSAADPGGTSAEAGFARDMSVHHGQAVEMAMALHPRTDDPQLRALTRDIALTQQAQIGRMQGWLVEWGLSPTGAEPPMTWMARAGGEHAAHASFVDGRMPGMATPQDVAALATLPADDAEVLFLQMTTAHHLAGVEMAEAGLAVLSEPDARTLAASIAAGQASEVEVLRDMLAARAASSEPAEAAGGAHAGH